MIKHQKKVPQIYRETDYVFAPYRSVDRLAVVCSLILSLGASLFIGVSLATVAIGSTTVTLHPIADSYVSSISPSANYGSSKWLNVSFDGALGYSYIMFDLSSIPGEANIISATLSLYLDDIGGAAPYGVLSIGAHYCSDNSWTELGITWNNKPSFSPTAYALGFYGMISMGRKSWNVTADVRTALATGKLTEVLEFGQTTGHGFARFDSREGTDKPQLIVQYSTKPVYIVQLESVQDTGVTANLGYVTLADTLFYLPNDVLVVQGGHQVTYNSGYEFVRWETTGGVSVSDSYAKTTTVTVSGDGTLRAVGSGRRVEYAYDDGEHDERGYGYPEMGYIEAVRFTTLLPGRLLAARFFIYSISTSQSNAFKVHVMDKNRNDLITPLVQTPISEGWFDVDLSSCNIIMNPGTEFYIGVEWVIKRNPRLGEDMDNPDKKSWIWNGKEWSEEEYLDYMIRAIVGEKAPSKISCSVSPRSIIVGKTIAISGSITPVLSGVTVTLTYARPNATTLTRTVTTDAAGNYNDVHAPDSVGSWIVTASWAGDDKYEAARSLTVAFQVTKASSAISLALSLSSLTIGSSITISGSITPPHAGATVSLTFTEPDGAQISRTVLSASDATYSDKFEPGVTGSWSVRTSWKGDADHEGVESSPASFTVKTLPSSITIYVSPEKITKGNSITISGAITPPLSAPVTLTFARPDGTTFEWNAVSNPAGSYSYDFTPDLLGGWSVKASWTGDERQSGAESQSAPFFVEVKLTTEKLAPEKTEETVPREELPRAGIDSSLIAIAIITAGVIIAAALYIGTKRKTGQKY